MPECIDVIGLITSMSDVTPVYVAGQNQSIPKRVIELKNTRYVRKINHSV